MTPEEQKQQAEDLACLNRILAFVKKEGFTGGDILKAIKENIEYVKNGGTL